MTDLSQMELQGLTLLQEGFPVRTSQLQEIKQDLLKKQGQACGQSAPVYLGTFDQNTPSLKTSQHCLTEQGEIGLSEFSGTFPRSGMMRNGIVYQLPNLARTITEIGSGSWSTPTASGANQRSISNIRKMRAHVDQGKMTVEEAEMMIEGSMTPKRMDQWFPTPAASDNRDRGNMSNPCLQRRVAKGKQVMLSQCHPTSGKLNPNWVEWLMGFPTGHTDLNS